MDTVRKCSETNSQFNNITKNITCKDLSKQPINLEDILHKPVARVQKNALVLHDLLDCVPSTHPDHNSLSEALQLTQNFLDQFNMIQTKSMFPVDTPKSYHFQKSILYFCRCQIERKDV